MSWKHALAYSKGILGRKDSNTDKIEDRGIPLGGRIGGLITWQQGPFIRAEASGGLVTTPAINSATIRSVSRVNLDLLSGKTFRFYLERGDDDSTEIFVQIYVDANGVPVEAMYCKTLTRIIPETEEDQVIFTGTDGYGLGERTYSLSRENLSEAGVNGVLLDTALNGAEEIEYVRAVYSDVDEHKAPFRGTETRLDDASGNTGLKQAIFYTPYFREFNGNEEYLLISTEIVESVNGDNKKRSIHVDFMLGIPLALDRLLIQ